MKRQTLAARATYLREHLDRLEDAAKGFSSADASGTTYDRQQARRRLTDAGIAYGLACKRYLGGREG